MHSDAGGVRRAGDSPARGRAAEFCVDQVHYNINVCEKTCVDLLYLRHVYNLVTAVIEMG